MNKLLMIIIVSLLLVGLIMFACSKLNDDTIYVDPSTPIAGDSSNGTTENGDSIGNTSTDETKKKDEIVINVIQDMVLAKLAVESKLLEREDVPSDIRFLADVVPVDNAKLTHISAYYTKSDFSQETYNILHDYIFMYFDEDNEKNVKISASKEGKPMRDYHFNTTEVSSSIEGVEVVISQYEEKYIATFSKGRYQFDVETNKLNEKELIKVVKMVIENTLVF